MLIDLHTHTAPYSACGRMSARELILRAQALGVDAVCVTDHMVIEGAVVAQEVGTAMGYPVFRGVEAAATVWGDVLVYGCHQDFPVNIPWTELCDTVLAAGGVLFAAHPFRRRDAWAFWKYLEQLALPLDANIAGLEVVAGLAGIETHNGGARPEENELAETLAHILGLPGIGGSDAHRVEHVGRSVTEFPSWISTDAELVAALKSGDFRPVSNILGQS